MADLTDRSAIDLRDALARGEVSAAEVTRAHLDQIDKRDPDIGAWAFLDGQTLVVNVMRIGADGKPELQVYRRTLTGGFMKLEFIRIVDGTTVRNATGRLIKVAG